MDRLTLALLLGLGFAKAAEAAVLDDLLSRGYSVAAATRLPGSFTGCVRQHRLVFADGSVFACAATAAQTTFEPRVYVLRLAGGPPSVVLAGSHVLAGELLRLGLHDYPVPLRMNADPLAEAAPARSAAIQPLRAVAGIDALTRQQDAPLSGQQDLLPTRPRATKPGR